MSSVALMYVCVYNHRPKYNDRVPGGGMVVADVGAIEEGSSDEEGDEEEPIYDQPDEGDEDFNE